MAAGNGGGALAQAALEELCRTYWFPLYAYIRRRGYEKEKAQDLTQEFFNQLLEHHWIEKAQPARGKFRSFLLSSVNHFLSNELRRLRAAKRGGGARIISLDDTAEQKYLNEVRTDGDPEKLFERRWLLSLFETALGHLRQQYTESGKRDLFETLKEFLSSEVEDGDYDRLGAMLGMTNGAVSTAVCRLRQRYGQLVRDEIAKTVSKPDDIEEEIRSLLRVLG